MYNKISELIRDENKKNPYTDDQIAAILKIKREQVTALRLQQGIPDSRERRKPYVLTMLRELLQKDPDISERVLEEKMRNAGFQISRFIIRQYKQELQLDSKQPMNSKEGETPRAEKGQEVQAKKNNGVIKDEVDCFAHIVGHRGSLKSLIAQSKAAVFYPPRGLHTLILGEPGVGKSDLAEAMCGFARTTGKIPETAPFVFFNCADYANNPQLLLAQLFGYMKGAFTGAESDKEGLVEKANGGILFLDEVHRLPPEGQELLFYLMDKGVFRRLGETAAARKADVMIVAATTENPESSLLITFRRRIPMVIEIPPISARPLQERYELITQFFHKEARRTKTPIEVSPDVTKALLLYDCPGNIGQILSDIQMSCARSFLNHIISQTSSMKITIEDLPPHARKGLLKIKNRLEVENIIEGNLKLHPDNEPVRPVAKEDLYTFPSEIYKYIEQRYQDLQNQGMQDDAINYVIGGDLEIRLKRMIKNIGANGRRLVKQDLIKIVGIEVVDIAEKMLKIAERKMGVAGEDLFYCLAIHLKTTLDRLREGKVIINPHLSRIKQSNPYEYKVAVEMCQLVHDAMNISIPEDEVGFITMYISTLTEKEESLEEGRVGLVLISHGHVAEGMADVANRLLGVFHAKSVEMSLDESPESALERAIEAVKNADEGKGVLLLVDMGSLVTFGELITQKTGIQTQVITRVDTLLAVEAVRRVIFQGAALDELAEALEESPKYISRLAKGFAPLKNDNPKALVTICITGEGAALKVKKLIEDLIPEIKEELEIIPMGALTSNVKHLIDELKKTRNIIAVVGTVNPDADDISFISIADIVRGVGVAKIRELLKINNNLKQDDDISEKPSVNVSLSDVLEQELIAIDPEVKTKDEIIPLLGQMLIDEGFVRRDFIKGVYEREALGMTYAGNQMAIPHADPSHVIKPGVAISKMEREIDWDGQKVNLVFMLALHTENTNIIQDVYKLLNSKEFREALNGVQNEHQLVDIIRHHLH